MAQDYHIAPLKRFTNRSISDCVFDYQEGLKACTLFLLQIMSLKVSSKDLQLSDIPARHGNMVTGNILLELLLRLIQENI